MLTAGALLALAAVLAVTVLASADYAYAHPNPAGSLTDPDADHPGHMVAVKFERFNKPTWRVVMHHEGNYTYRATDTSGNVHDGSQTGFVWPPESGRYLDLGYAGLDEQPYGLTGRGTFQVLSGDDILLRGNVILSDRNWVYDALVSVDSITHDSMALTVTFRENASYTVDVQERTRTGGGSSFLSVSTHRVDSDGLGHTERYIITGLRERHNDRLIFVYVYKNTLDRVNDKHVETQTASSRINPVVTVDSTTVTESGATITATAGISGSITARIRDISTGDIVHSSAIGTVQDGAQYTVTASGLRPGTIHRYDFAMDADDDFNDRDSVSAFFRTSPRTSTPLTLGEPALQTVDEGGTVNYLMPRNNPEGYDITWSILSGQTGNADIDGDGRFTWTTRDTDGRSEPYEFVILASAPLDMPRRTLAVMVNRVNDAPPTVEPVGDIDVSAGDRIAFQINANDTDTGDDGLRYLLVDPLPPGVGAAGDILDQSTGYFDWTPGEDQRGVHTISLRVEDGLGGHTDQSFVIKVHGPALRAIPDSTILEHDMYTFNASLVEGLDASVHTFGLEGEPDGAAINSTTGRFDWMPSEEQGGESHTFTVTVMNQSGARVDAQNVTVTVTEYNPPPVVEPIGDFVVNIGQTVSFNVSATDIQTVKPLLYFLDFYLPLGVGGGPEILNSSTGYFEWTPNENHTGTHVFHLHVSDGQPMDRGVTRQEFRISVNHILKAVPVDIRIPEHTRFVHNFDFVDGISNHTFGLREEPGGATINATTGIFVWTPAERRNSAYNFRLVALNGSGDIVDEQNLRFHIVRAGDASITEFDPLVSFGDIAPQSADEGGTIRYQIPLDNPDGLDVAWSVSSGQTGDAAVNDTGFFTWTTTESDGSDTPYEFGINATTHGIAVIGTLSVTVNETNENPAFDDVRTEYNQTAGEPFMLDLNATDSDRPPQTLTYSIESQSDSTNQADIDSGNGTITWTPDESGTKTIRATVQDSFDPPGSDTLDIVIMVAGTAVTTPPPDADAGPPVFDNDTRTHHVLPVGETLTLELQAEDPDGGPVTYELVRGGGNGDAADFGTGDIALDRDTGVLTWTQSSEGLKRVLVRAVDAMNDTSDGLGLSFASVLPNRAPSVTDIPDAAILAEKTLVFVASADDPDDDAKDVLFALSGRPDGAAINATTGLFSWTPAASQTGPHHVTVTASDGQLESHANFTVTVTDTPGGAGPVANNDHFTVAEDTELVIDAADLLDNDMPGGAALESLGRSTNLAGSIEGRTVTIRPHDDYSGRAVIPYTITSDGGSASADIIVDVTPVDDPVAFANTTVLLQLVETFGDRVIAAGQRLTFLLPVDDPDGDVLDFVLSGGPDGASVQGNRFDWTPTMEQAGQTMTEYDMTVTVTDGTHTDSGNLTITVLRDPTAPGSVAAGDLVANHDYAEVAQDTIIHVVHSDIYPNDLPPDPDLIYATTRSRTHVNAEILGLQAAPAADMFAGFDRGFSGTARFNIHVWLPGANIDTGEDDKFPLFIFNVTAVDLPPVLYDIEDVAIPEGRPFRFALPAADPDTPTRDLVFGAEGMPEGMELSGGWLEWTPHEHTGNASYAFNVTVSDGTDTVRQEVGIDVFKENRPPVFEDIQTLHSTLVGVPLRLAFSATDTDIPEQTVTYSSVSNATENPVEVTMSGRIVWTPDRAETQAVTITATDNHDPPANASITVVLRAISDTPSPAPPPAPPPTPPPSDTQPAVPVDDRTVTAPVSNATITGMLEAYMSQNLVAFSGHPAPWLDAARNSTSAGFLIAGILVNGAYAGMPGDLAVSDVITVFVNEAGNVPPVLWPIGNYTINAQDTLAFAVSATDFNDTVSYRLAGAPAGAEISEQGEFSWMPGSADVGGHTFMITAYDRHNATDTESVAVTVLTAGTPNRSPNAPDVAATVPSDGRIVIIPAISDPDDDPVRITGAAGDAGGTVTFGSDRIWYVAGPAPGAETVTYTVTDSRGAGSARTITIIIR